MVARIKARSTSVKLSDIRLRSNIWNEIQEIQGIRFNDLKNLSVSVHNGEILLKGHLTKEGYKQRIESIVANITGLASVKNELINDRELKCKVAQALAKDPRTRPFFVCVGAFYGWVHLSGKVPLAKDQAVVEEVAASVQEVRGVVTLPYIGDRKKTDKHHVVQPSIGARIYDHENSLGLVDQVVIDPHNRLVIGVIVEAALQVNGERKKGYYFIASRFMKLVNEGGVILDDSIPDMTKSPLFNQVEYMAPPGDWRPPYPYKYGEVFWPKN
jgi:osmotically-inducible protein OsmY